MIATGALGSGNLSVLLRPRSQLESRPSSWRLTSAVSSEKRAAEEAAAMSTVRWSAIRDKHVEAIGREDVERGTSRLISQVRAHRLADMRKRHGVTQREVAQAMGVNRRTGSQIENGELSSIDVLGRYVTALGGLSKSSSLRRRTVQGRLSAGVEDRPSPRPAAASSALGAPRLRFCRVDERDKLGHRRRRRMSV